MSRARLYSLIWTVVFGVALALGGSFLEIIRIPVLNVTMATFWVAILVTLNKLVLAQRLSVTRMYLVASIIAIFTPYLGPPSPLKPMLILAGLFIRCRHEVQNSNHQAIRSSFGSSSNNHIGFLFSMGDIPSPSSCSGVNPQTNLSWGRYCPFRCECACLNNPDPADSSRQSTRERKADSRPDIG